MFPQWHQIESPLPMQDCADRLRKAIDPSNLLDLPAAGGKKPVYGYVEEGWFELWQRGPRNERGVNALQGSLAPSSVGTIVRFRWAWDNGRKWATWLSVGAAVAFSLVTLSLMVVAYAGPLPGPRPFAWAVASVPAIVAPVAVYLWRRTTFLAEQQQQFLLTFLERTVKAGPPEK